MIRNVINGSYTTEIYKIGADMKRGTVVTKDLTNKVAGKADSVSLETYFVDFNYVPTGHLSDVEISAYSTDADTVKADTLGILIKPGMGSQWATDQVVATGLAAGDYLVAGTTTNVGKLIKAVSTNVSIYKYIGTFVDNGKTLYRFEVVEPKTIA